MFPITSDTGRQGQQHLLVVLLVVVGLALVEASGGRRGHASKQHKYVSMTALCELPPKEVGDCKKQYERWSYVQSTGLCEKFNWSGCGGNDNKFGSLSLCKAVCYGPESKPVRPADPTERPSACMTQMISGPCGEHYEKRYYYNADKDECQKVKFPACTISKNAFNMPSDCMETCQRPKVCALPPFVPGRDNQPCDGRFRSWSYDKWEDKCVRWYYGGCSGNENRFSSQAKCEQTCLGSYVPATANATTTTTLKPNYGGPIDWERCNARLPAEPMDCRVSSVYAFDKSSGKCRAYPRCRETANSFESRSECEQACLGRQPTTTSTLKPSNQTDVHKRPSACVAPKDLRPCNASQLWSSFSTYFDADKAECQRVPENSCARGENNFHGLLRCQKTCLTSKELCELPSKVLGHCDALTTAWSYVKSSGKCEEFIWGGCGGNGNTFRSQSECEQACLGRQPTTTSTLKPSNQTDVLKRPKACMTPKDLGPCNAGQRWSSFSTYFDADKAECQRVPKNSCARGENNFQGLWLCQKTCLTSKELCELPSKVTGHCRALTRAWSYVKSSGKCEEFIWGGCGGNGNTFRSQSECEKTCPSPTTRPPVSTTPKPDEREEEED